MPWSAAEFKAKHAHKLSDEAADKAARMANSMLGRGVPEGEAIATAIKHGRSVMRHAARRKGGK